MRISDWSSDVCSSDLLEEVGAHVSYGVVGHKTHAKMVLVLRREKGHIRRYGHLGTGNYHPKTARLYTDFGLLTADQKMRSEEHTSELQSLMRISYDVFCLKTQKINTHIRIDHNTRS